MLGACYGDQGHLEFPVSAYRGITGVGFVMPSCQTFLIGFLFVKFDLEELDSTDDRSTEENFRLKMDSADKTRCH